MRVFLIVCVIILSSCAFNDKKGAHYRLYQIYDMEDLLQDYYTNDLKRISPGIACDDFKMENCVGCFKLIVDKRHNKVVKLIYHELTSGITLQLYKFDPPVDNVFIEKIYFPKLNSSMALPETEEVVLQAGQPSIKLIFFEKSSVVFYWKDGTFHKIWTGD